MSLTLRVSVGLIARLLLGFIVSTGHSPWLMPIPAIFDPIGGVFVDAIRVAVIPLSLQSYRRIAAEATMHAGSAGSADARSRLSCR